MLMPWPELMRRHAVDVRGIIHVGAFDGDEAKYYGQQPVVWIEGNPDLIPALVERFIQYPRHTVIQALLSDRIGEAEFHIASNGQSSSMLELGTHATEHPEVTYVGSKLLPTTTLDHLAKTRNVHGSFLSIDAQGSELDILKGGESVLASCTAVLLELNDRELYRKCALRPEVEAWMAERGFALRELFMTRAFWGDGLFVRVDR